MIMMIKHGEANVLHCDDDYVLLSEFYGVVQRWL